MQYINNCTLFVVPGLPFDFHHLLSLSELKLDNNTHMVYPPVTVIEKGIDSIRVWCKRRVADRQHNRRHTIVLTLQNVLSQIHEVRIRDTTLSLSPVRVNNRKIRPQNRH